jgi:hypothetical protein
VTRLAAKNVANKVKAFTFLILIACFASLALVDDFKTIDGKEYKTVKVSGVEPDGIVLRKTFR